MNQLITAGAFFLNFSITVDGFTGKVSAPYMLTGSSHRFHLLNNHRKSTETKAMIYSWDEQENGINNKNGLFYWEDENEETFINKGLNNENTIVEYLADENRISSLARLAVAFSPPDRRINLKDIEKIEISFVDSEHIQIVAAVRHEEACVQLLVPIKFPNSCRDVSNVEECVIDNIDTLDQDAGHKIDGHKIQDEMFELYYDIERSTITEFPSWWIHPYTYELVQECDTIKRLLNEAEFQDEVKALAMKAVNAAAGESPIVLERVVVTDVGPSGLNFRARAASTVKDEKFLLEVSYKFQTSNAIESADALRAAVLGAVAEGSI